MQLNDTLVFAASAGEGASLYMAGGRRYIHEERQWQYLSLVWRYNARRKKWKQLPDLDTPTADACMVVFSGNIVVIGGSKGRYRYADDPSKVWVLRKGSGVWRDDILPELLANRMWHSCVVTKVEGEARN